MKAYLLVVALAAVSACGKHNDVAILQHEAVSLATYYQARLDLFEKRVTAIMQRDLKIPGDFPGLKEAGGLLREANDTLQQLKGIVGKGADGKSEAEKQADALAKQGKAEDLEKLVHDTEDAIARGITVINGDLDAVESWVAQYDRKLLAAQALQVAQSSPAGSEPPAPEPQATPPAAQPPGPAPATEQPKAEQPKQPTPAQPKAEQPKAGQPKPGQPKHPAPAQPKP
jgi:hypothetical protein